MDYPVTHKGGSRNPTSPFGVVSAAALVRLRAAVWVGWLTVVVQVAHIYS